MRDVKDVPGGWDEQSLQIQRGGLMFVGIDSCGLRCPTVLQIVDKGQFIVKEKHFASGIPTDLAVRDLRSCPRTLAILPSNQLHTREKMWLNRSRFCGPP